MIPNSAILQERVVQSIHTRKTLPLDGEGDTSNRCETSKFNILQILAHHFL